MAKRRKTSLMATASELAVLAPAVAGARLLRMGGEALRGRSRASAWPLLASEKAFATQEAWLGAAGAIVALQQRAFAAALSAAWSPWPGGNALAWWQRRQAEAEDIAHATLAPVSRRVKRNARRPGR